MHLEDIGKTSGPAIKTALLVAVLVVSVKTHLFTTLFGVTASQEITIAILIMAAVLWITEWIQLFVTSFMILLLEIIWLLPMMNKEGIEVKQEVFLSPFFSNIILLFLGGFVLSSLLHKFKLDTMFADIIMKRTGGKPKRVLLGVILVCAFLSMWISNTATTAMMLVMVLPIISTIPEENLFGRALALAIPFACNLGGIATPIGTPPNAIAVAYLTEKGYTIGFGEWMLYTVPFLAVFLVLLWWLLLWLYPPGDLEIEIPTRKRKKLEPKQIVALIIFILTAVGWCTGKLHGLKTGTVALLPIIACFGGGLLSREDFKQLPWDVLYMVAGGMVLGVGIQYSGLGEVLVGLVPVDSSFFLILIAASLLAVVMTTFMSNTATANLIIPIAMALGIAIGDKMILIVTMAFLCSTAMALPISTPPNAIAFSSGVLESKHMIKPGLMITAGSFVIVLLFGSYYWRLVGLAG